MLVLDNEYNEKIIGVDEAGRGPLAGPVVACALYLKDDKLDLSKLNDSKKLTDKQRREIYNILINSTSVVYGIGIVNNEIIDEINILNATFLAMKNAVINTKLDFEKFLILVDGNKKIKDFDIKQEAIIKGDSKSKSIAAASIIAKVTRDNLMLEYSKKYPNYYFENHKGYGTKKHYEMIKKYGIVKIHRLSFLKGVVDNE